MGKTIYTKQSEILRQEIIHMRKTSNLTQRALAQLLKRERSYVARLELGERRLDVIEFFWVCRACKMNPVKIAGKLMRKFEESAT